MTTPAIEILADSTCDIPQDLVEQYHIGIIPQIVIWDNREYRDRIDLQPEEFYQRFQCDPQRPTTSLPGMPAFLTAYEQAAQRRGASQLVVLTISSAMSGTYQMALEAARRVEIPVHVVDSKGPTMSLGWQTLAAARARDRGASLAEILETVEAVRSRLVQVVAMHSLEYLKTGGRLGGATKWAGIMLKIKPLVGINHDTGLVEPVTIARTQNGLVEAMYENFFKRLGPGPTLHVAVLHGNVADEAQELARRIRREYSPAELLVNITGPVLGVNTGPGALALCGYRDW
jgi:DegV family protein with EDD domain